MKLPLVFAAATLLATPAAQGQAPASAAQANALCREIIDARDYATFKAAQDQSLDLTLAAAQKLGAPSAAEAKRLAGLLAAVNDDLTAAIEQLGELPPSPALEEFLAYGQSRIDINTARIGFLDHLEDWQWPMADSFSTNTYDYTAGMEALGFTHRDCTFVFGSPGNPPEIADFITTVAPACMVAYEDLMASDLDQWREANLNAMVAVIQGKPQQLGTVEALRSLAAAWKTAYYAFLLVDTNVADKPPLWEETLSILNERARIFKDRADALQYRDEDGIKEAFAQRIVPPDFEKLGLRETSCMALAKLM